MTQPKIVGTSAGEAFHHTVDLLFKPFSWKRWARFVLIAWMAGALTGGCNLGGSGRNESARTTAPAAKTQVTTAHSETSNSALSKKMEKQHAKKYWFEHSLLKSARDSSGKIPKWYMAWVVWPVVAFIAFLILAFIIFWIWLSARFQFIWVHAVRTGEVQIRRPFRVYENPADSLTTFSCWAALVVFLYFAAVIAPGVGVLFSIAGKSSAAFTDILFLVRYLWPWVALLAFSLLVTVLFFTIVSDFVVPLMASDPIYFKEAFGKWLGLYKANRLAVWRYFLAKMLISVLGGALTMAAVLFALIAFALLGALLFGLPYLIFMVLLKMKVLFWILVVALGLPFGVALIFAFSVCALPVSLFFRSFSLRFLENLIRPALLDTP